MHFGVLFKGVVHKPNCGRVVIFCTVATQPSPEVRIHCTFYIVKLVVIDVFCTLVQCFGEPRSLLVDGNRLDPYRTNTSPVLLGPVGKNFIRWLTFRSFREFYVFFLRRLFFLGSAAGACLPLVFPLRHSTAAFFIAAEYDPPSRFHTDFTNAIHFFAIVASL